MLHQDYNAQENVMEFSKNKTLPPALTDNSSSHDTRNDYMKQNSGTSVQLKPKGKHQGEIDIIVDMLTEGSRFSPERLESLSEADKINPLSAQEILHRIKDLGICLETICHSVDMPADRKSEINKLIEASDLAGLKRLGINPEYAGGINNMLAAILHGRPPVDIETVGPYACEHLDENGHLQIDEDSIPPNEMIGIELAAMFRQLADRSNSPVRIVTLLDELNNYREGDIDNVRFSTEEQNEYILKISEYFSQKGIIKPDDDMGDNVLILRESEQLGHIPELLERLGASGKGKISRSSGKDGEETIVFKPTDELISSLDLKSKSRRKELKKNGILLIKDGEPMCQALDASAFLKRENQSIIHLVMLDEEMASQQDKVFTILSALDIARPETYHNIFTDSTKLTPKEAKYAVARFIQHELSQVNPKL